MFITASMDDHDEEKRREHNLFVRSGKSEAGLALDILYKKMYCTIEATGIHPALSSFLCV